MRLGLLLPDPREQGQRRLDQVRESGYRLIDVYVPWNFHELEPGRYDFTGRRDLAAFLDLAAAAGLGVIARPGPYICSEWDGGALPAWLTLEPGLRLRQAEPGFLRRVAQWFDQVMPVLAEHEAGRGGCVVAVQLENELDFFDTADRAAYVGALRDLARERGVSVPLIACAGQGDPTGATGGVQGVTPAFNFYPDDRSPFVETEVRHYADLCSARGEPLLVTETNRRHVTLRRLLVSGATMLAPYLQVSGYNFGFTPSVGNWGDPGGFMAHDYDFGGFVGPTGDERPELTDARVLAAVLRTLGDACALGTPVAADGAYETDAPTSDSPSALELAGGGRLLGVTNLGENAAPATLPARAGLPAVPVTVAPMSCLLVLQDLPLGRFALPGRLALATADLVGAGPAGLTFASAMPSTVVLEPDEGGSVLAELAAPAPGEPVQVTLQAGETAWQVEVVHPADVRADGGREEEGADQPRPNQIRPDENGPDGSRVGTRRADEEGGTAVTVVREVHLAPLPAGGHYVHAPWSEELGVHRGRTHYSTSVAEEAELLVEGAADIVDVAVDALARPTRAPLGATFRCGVRGATSLAATVETWGHANFDDARLPARRLGSLRGLGAVWSVLDERDVSSNWTVRAPGGWPGDPAPLRGLGGWSSTRLGEPVTYRRSLPVDGVHDHALHLPGLHGSVLVEVDGSAHVVSEQNPWLHLGPGEGDRVAITSPHRPGGFGPARLVRLRAVVGWDVQAENDAALMARVGRATPGASVELPVELAPGQERWFEATVPSGSLRLRALGRQVRVSVVAGDELLGRLWLDDPARPRFTGGDGERVWLPGEWNTGSIRFGVRATAGDHPPRLDGLLLDVIGP